MQLWCVRLMNLLLLIEAKQWSQASAYASSQHNAAVAAAASLSCWSWCGWAADSSSCNQRSATCVLVQPQLQASVCCAVVACCCCCCQQLRVDAKKDAVQLQWVHVPGRRSFWLPCSSDRIWRRSYKADHWSKLPKEVRCRCMHATAAHV